MFNEKKAIAAITYILKLSGGQCDKYWLNKVVYYLERQSLLETGQPMFFDELYSIKFGPILSQTNDAIDNTIKDSAEIDWSPYLTLSDEIHVKLIKTGNFDLLSDYEIDLIKETYQNFKDKDFSAMKKIFHQLPEHIEVPRGRKQLSYDHVFRSSGLYDEEQIQEALNEIHALAFYQEAFSCG